MTPEPSGFTFMRQLPADLPEVLDLLVVGGGPGGTMAAFRARELGLRTLVVDYDDILKRIRDYSKDKLILPDFGGGDKLSFPDGGELVRSLHFSPIDKDEMHQGWKRLYAEHGVPVQVGVELTGLERQAEDVWCAVLWDHNERRERRIRTRSVVIAIGRGVPRRFDIPGNTDGIAHQLSDPALYLGRPACIVGGGTSAAEAVIAVSNAKAAAEDPTAVYWSYRGDRLPRVSKALAEVFFEAYVGNGNIRYHPRSEPVAVVVGDDREEYLAIRVDRRRLEGRPHETVHLEFPKECCIACIGEDIPEAFLAELGIPMVAASGSARKRMLVTPHLETVQPGVHLVGDILSQSYFETDDFDAGPSSHRERKHRGNIKTALRDGVLVAQVVAQRLAGGTEIRGEVRDAEPADAPAGSSTGPPAAVAAAAGKTPPPKPTELLEGNDSAERRAAVTTAEPQGEEGGGLLVQVLPGGVDGEEHPLAAGDTLTIGRDEGAGIRFPDDTELSDLHASIAPGPKGPTLRDEGSATGVFLRARPGEATELAPGAVFRAGRQFLRLEGGDGAWQLGHYDDRGIEQDRHPLDGDWRIFGRDAPDVILAAADATLSRRHFAAAIEDGRVRVKDLKSVNGTWLRVRPAAVLRPGDELRVGGQTLRYEPPVELKPRPETGKPTALRKAPDIAEPEPAPKYTPTGEPEVTFQGVGRTVAVKPGQTICEAAEESGLPINAECHAGICGSDPIRVLSGFENLSPLDAGEAETLEDLCSLEPGKYRLACMCRVRGSVVVELADAAD